MSIIETLNGGVPYATGTKVEAVDLNNLSANDRANALAARTAWTLGAGPDPIAMVSCPWSSEGLKELIFTESDRCYAHRFTSTLDRIYTATTGLAAEHYVTAGGNTRLIEAIKVSDWTDGYYSTGSATFTAFTPTSTPGTVTGPACWMGSAVDKRLVPGVATGTGDGYPAFLVGSGNSTWTEFSYPTTEEGPVYRIAGGTPGGTSWAISVGKTVMSYGSLSGTMTWGALPTLAGHLADSIPGIAWDASRSVFVMTRYLDTDEIAFATSPTGATWTDFRTTSVGASSALPVVPRLADICVIDGAWFILRPSNYQGMWGGIYTLLCSLDAGASWVDMCLPAIEVQGDPGNGVPQYGIMSHLGRLVIYTADTLAISSVIAVPAAVASEAI
jgi:hypothetical protein